MVVRLAGCSPRRFAHSADPLRLPRESLPLAYIAHLSAPLSMGRMFRTVATLRGVRKTVGSGSARRALLDDVDLELEDGKLTVVIGRSGSGKSTLLHLLGGLERVDAGE